MHTVDNDTRDNTVVVIQTGLPCDFSEIAEAVIKFAVVGCHVKSRFNGTLPDGYALDTPLGSSDFSPSEGTFPNLGANSTEFADTVNIYLNGVLLRPGTSFDVEYVSST